MKGKIDIIASLTPPSIHDMWLNISNNHIYRYGKSGWEPVGGGAEAMTPDDISLIFNSVFGGGGSGSGSYTGDYTSGSTIAIEDEIINSVGIGDYDE